MQLWQFFLFLHVLGAIAAFGPGFAAMVVGPMVAKEPQHGSVVHVEFTTPNLDKAQKLYSEVFGWQFHPFQPTEMYFQTPGNFGPCGCMLQGTPGTSATTDAKWAVSARHASKLETETTLRSLPRAGLRSPRATRRSGREYGSGASTAPWTTQ